MPYPRSDHFDGKKFHNLNPEAVGREGILAVLKWKLSTTPQTWPDLMEDNHPPNIVPRVHGHEARFTYINHASMLIQYQGINMITDPHFSLRTSPLQFLGPRRHRKAGLEIDQLPPIDFVLISHNHYDHMDTDSLKALEARFHPKYFVGLGDRKNLPAECRASTTEMDWWQEHTLEDGVKIIYVPVQHWSSRTPFDTNDALWGGYVIHSREKKIFFAGDTGYADHFKKLRERMGPMDVSLLPIGAYEPRWFMKDNHMNPEDAVLAHIDLESKQSLGIHFGTFQLTDEGMEDPVVHLKEALLKHKQPLDKFIAPKNGQVFVDR